MSTSGLAEKRARVEKELLDTEISYCYSIRVLNEVFYVPLLKNTQEDKPLISRADLDLIFGPLGEIIFINSEFLKHLYSPSVSIVDAFKATVPYFGRIYGTYSRSFEKGKKRLTELRKNTPKFNEFIENAETDDLTKKQRFASLHVLPVQRIPRYSLLVSQLLKYTPESDPEHEELKKVLSSIDEVCVKVNEAVRDYNDMVEVLVLEDKLIGKDVPPLLKEGRKFLKQGSFKRDGKDESVHLALFTDILIVSRLTSAKKLRMKACVNTYAISVNFTGKILSLRFLSKDRDAHVVCKNDEEGKCWESELRKAIDFQKTEFIKSGATSQIPVMSPPPGRKISRASPAAKRKSASNISLDFEFDTPEPSSSQLTATRVNSLQDSGSVSPKARTVSRSGSLKKFGLGTLRRQRPSLRGDNVSLAESDSIDSISSEPASPVTRSESSAPGSPSISRSKSPPAGLSRNNSINSMRTKSSFVRIHAGLFGKKNSAPDVHGPVSPITKRKSSLSVELQDFDKPQRDQQRRTSSLNADELEKLKQATDFSSDEEDDDHEDPEEIKRKAKEIREMEEKLKTELNNTTGDISKFSQLEI